MNRLLQFGGSSGSLFQIERGSGTVETDDAPAWLNGTSGTCIGEHACDDVDKTPNHLKAKPDEAALQCISALVTRWSLYRVADRVV